MKAMPRGHKNLGLLVLLLGLPLTALAVACGGGYSTQASSPPTSAAAVEATPTTATAPTQAAVASAPTSTSAPAPAATAVPPTAVPPTATTAPAPTTPPAPPAAPAPASAAVNIIDFGFVPASLSVQAGQPVTINVRNTGQVPHTFTIDGVVDSGRLSPGATATVQFTAGQPGTYTFYCTIHGKARMSGTITVTGSAAADPGSAGSNSGSASATAGGDASYGYEGY